jgi:hypothetical protein
MAELTAYWVSETTIIAARSPDEAHRLFLEMVGPEWSRDFGYEPPRALTDADLDERYPEFDEDERPIPGATFSFRERLARMTAPGVLADWE